MMELQLLILREKKPPCIIVEDKKYGLIRAKIEGQPFSVNTDLNILQDGLRKCFC